MSESRPQITLNRRRLLECGLAGTAASAFPAFFLGGCGKSTAKRPNIFLISIDTLRADHLGCYGYERDTSPAIDAFTTDALRFEKCFSQAPNTWAGFASLLSGFLPHETRVVEDVPVPEGVRMLPEILQEVGYTTAAAVSNFVLRDRRGFDQGFEEYDADLTDRQTQRSRPERLGEDTTEVALRQLEKAGKDPLFLWLHYQDPHGPYAPPARFDEFFPVADRKPRLLPVNAQPTGWRGIPSYQVLGEERNYHEYVARYDREIRYMDGEVHRFLTALKERGLYDDSLIIFTADHGEGMGTHDHYFAHGENLFSDLLHVPLVMRYGNRLRGKRPDAVQHLDVVPTILNLLGLRHEFRYRGRDLRLPAEAPAQIVAEMPAFQVPQVPNASIMEEGFKLIHIALNQEPWHSFELYDTNLDPTETNNLLGIPAFQKRFEHLEKSLRRIRGEDTVALTKVDPPPKLSEEELEHLRSLGYVGDDETDD